MKVVRTPENNSQKVVPVYPLEAIDAPASTQTNNIVKVQPNNFLIDNKLKIHSNSNSSSLIDFNKSNYSPKNNLINPNNHVINNEINTFQDISYIRKADSLRQQTLTANILKSDQEKADSETNVDITSTKNIGTKLRASKQQGATILSHVGTRNILLDNAHNITPMVLTKTTKNKEIVVQSEMANTETSSENMLR